MVIYEVNLLVENSVAEDFRAWLDDHIQEILRIDGFVSAELLSIESQDDVKRAWTVQYRLRDQAVLDSYLKNHAPRLREEGIKRFGGFFSASRRVLEVVKKW